MFLALEFFWVALFFIISILRNKFPMQEFAICLGFGFLAFVSAIYAQGVDLAFEFGLKISFMLICCLFVIENIKLASATFLVSYAVYFLFLQTFGLKGALLPAWTCILIPLFLYDFKDALKKINYIFIIIFLSALFVYFTFFSFRTQIFIFVLAILLYLFTRLSKPMIYFGPVLLFLFFVYFGSQFFYFYDDNIENISRSNIQRGFFNFYIFLFLPDFLFGKNIYVFSQEMWYLLPDLFAVSSYNTDEVDPHNIVGFFLLIAGIPGIFLLFLIIFALTRNIAIKDNKIISVILISSLVAVIALGSFSAPTRLTIAVIIGILHAVTKHEKTDNNYNLF